MNTIERPRALSLLFLVFFLLFVLSSCRWKFPDAQEGEALKAKGLFAGRPVPAWLNQSKSGTPSAYLRSGFINQGATLSPGVVTQRQVHSGYFDQNLAEMTGEGAEELNPDQGLLVNGEDNLDNGN